ncbi:MAG: hypothetical protein Q4A84_09855 [Neisseria sp.]|uniref:hypothetical protein n=1 Tax=Neisseria sp. TaxID=192066 RepID=UPI0026DD758B|nr:hypothetical protein [Neisseria sp.]MDO4641983.1 hypothetical protein [Neisseria sp.]
MNHTTLTTLKSLSEHIQTGFVKTYRIYNTLTFTTQTDRLSLQTYHSPPTV